MNGKDDFCDLVVTAEPVGPTRYGYRFTIEAEPPSTVVVVDRADYDRLENTVAEQALAVEVAREARRAVQKICGRQHDTIEILQDVLNDARGDARYWYNAFVVAAACCAVAILVAVVT